MAFSFETADDGNAVGTFFKSPHDMNHIDFSGAGHPNDPQIGRVLQSHRTCQVRGRVASEIAAKGNDNGVKIFAHGFLSKSICLN
jgi:hypothetical protein